jgi:hypothetical protein
MGSSIFTLTSCVSIRRAIASREIDSLAKGLPHPSNAVLMETVKGVDGGSDKRCYTLYVRQLYGANQQFGEILAFYEAQLTSEETWQTIERFEEGDRSWISFNHSRGSRLGIVEITAIPPFSLVQGFSEDILTDGLSRFISLYSIDIQYADAATRARCWVD